MNEILNEMNQSVNDFYVEANKMLVSIYRNKVKSGEWNFYIIPERLGFIYIIEKSDDSDFKVLNKELVEEYGIY